MFNEVKRNHQRDWTRLVCVCYISSRPSSCFVFLVCVSLLFVFSRMLFFAIGSNRDPIILCCISKEEAVCKKGLSVRRDSSFGRKRDGQKVGGSTNRYGQGHENGDVCVCVSSGLRQQFGAYVCVCI